jgi:hypothetical protein
MFMAPDRDRQDARGRIDKAVGPPAGYRAKRRDEQALPRRIPSNSGKTGKP